MSAEVSDGDLVRLARGGDPVAFRLLVERHQPMVRARARQVGEASDVDDIAQESFLQAYLALDRLRDPDRFAGWLAGIVFNVGRSLRRRAPVTLLADWPEPLHPASATGLPSAEELDRADAINAAVSSLPVGQRRSVALHYYAGVPAGQVADTPGAARASLHKARLRLRAYLTEHRPDLVPTGRTAMTTVRLARIARRIPPGPVPDRFPTHVIVLADDARGRELPIWLLGQDSHRFDADAQAEPAADELTGRLLDAAGARVTSVEIGELGPEVTVARIALATPGGPAQVAARLADGLAMAIIAGAPIRVTDALLDRMAVPAGTSQDGPVPEQTARDLRLDARRPHQEHNLSFAEGLEHWMLGGSFTEHAVQARWRDYSATAQQGTAVLAAAVPQPTGFAWLAQEILAGDYHGAAVTFRGQFRAAGATGLAGLFVRIMEPRDVRGPFTAAEARADPKNHLVAVVSEAGWAGYEVTAPVPAGASTFIFGVFLAGPGRIELRRAELTRAG
ncbi:MAG TPA: bifunctional nuclease domain-containing protein [Streptosporangiaceae bacterium]|nr:bifunctional nuclease domain-containing protein [Streptosporangiaceae bacterium]